MARVLGTSSPITICTTTAMASAAAMDRPVAAPPATRSATGSRAAAMEGRAMKPSASEVAVMPNWAPESWNDRVFSSDRVVRAARRPSAAKRSTRRRSTATRANSTATNTALAAISSPAAAKPTAVVQLTEGQPSHTELGTENNL